MNKLSHDEIWERVKKLQGQTLCTYVENEENKILSVEDTGSKNDRVVIESRDTTPVREDILAACDLLFLLRSLNRKKDLEWLAKPEKKTSSIIFRIVGEITNDIAKVDLRSEPKILMKKS